MDTLEKEIERGRYIEERLERIFREFRERDTPIGKLREETKAWLSNLTYDKMLILETHGYQVRENTAMDSPQRQFQIMRGPCEDVTEHVMDILTQGSYI